MNKFKKHTFPKTLILTIGDEILLGQITNSNSEWLAQNLFNEGFNVSKMISIGDEYSEIMEELQSSANIFDLIIITGGLGPTNDDKTKKVLSDFFEMPLVINNEVLSDITALILKRANKTELNERNKAQALVPEGCTVFRSMYGTAPGMAFKTNKHKATVIALPGVPFEMKWIYENRVYPFLKEHFTLTKQNYDIFYVTGIPEAALAHILEDWEASLPAEMKLAYLPAAGVIRLRLHKGKIKTEQYDSIVTQLYKLIGNNIVAKNTISFAAGLTQLLSDNNLTVSVAESCTGGNIAHSLTLISGASKFFPGSVVAYSNEVKINLLNVPKELIIKHGAVSQEVVEKMAKGVQKLFSADISIAVTGIAGPEGGTSEKPVGTVWISVCIKDNCYSEKFTFGSLRENNIERATNTAIFMAYRYLTQHLNS